MNKTPIEFKVMDLLKFISQDTQLTKNDPDYLGYMNCSEDGFLNPDNGEAFVALVTNLQYYTCMLFAFELNIEAGFDLDETIFHTTKK